MSAWKIAPSDANAVRSLRIEPNHGLENAASIHLRRGCSVIDTAYRNAQQHVPGKITTVVLHPEGTSVTVTIQQYSVMGFKDLCVGNNVVVANEALQVHGAVTGIEVHDQQPEQKTNHRKLILDIDIVVHTEWPSPPATLDCTSLSMFKIGTWQPFPSDVTFAVEPWPTPSNHFKLTYNRNITACNVGDVLLVCHDGNGFKTQVVAITKFITPTTIVVKPVTSMLNGQLNHPHNTSTTFHAPSMRMVTKVERFGFLNPLLCSIESQNLGYMYRIIRIARHFKNIATPPNSFFEDNGVSCAFYINETLFVGTGGQQQSEIIAELIDNPLLGLSDDNFNTTVTPDALCDFFKTYYAEPDQIILNVVPSKEWASDVNTAHMFMGVFLLSVAGGGECVFDRHVVHLRVPQSVNQLSMTKLDRLCGMLKVIQGTSNNPKEAAQLAKLVAYKQTNRFDRRDMFDLWHSDVQRLARTVLHNASTEDSTGTCSSVTTLQVVLFLTFFLYHLFRFLQTSYMLLCCISPHPRHQ